MVSPAEDGNLETPFTSESNCRHHIGSPKRSNDDSRMPVDRRVPDRPRHLVSLVSREQYVTPKSGSENGDIVVRQRLVCCYGHFLTN
jgi:hypothetical protein